MPDPGGAAYYGPKISVQARDAIGRTWQMSTVQYDFNQPARFGLEYQAADGSRQQPVMIHSAKFGSIERFLGVLVEHYAGAFPPWLAPVQVVGIPITDEHVPYLEEVAARLRTEGIRVEVDTSDDRMQKKIRTAQKQKVPFMLLAGDEDVSKGAVSFRYRNGEQKNAVPVDEAVAEIVQAVAEPGAGVTDRLELLWAPHRMAYVTGEEAAPELDGCPFCRIPGLDDKAGLVVARGDEVYAVLNKHPYNPGHLMVVPYRHVAELEDLTDAEMLALAEMTRQAVVAIKKVSSPAWFQRGAQPRGSGRRVAGRPPAPARRTALGR